METYGNLSGQSGVARYEIGASYIVVEFKISGKSGARFYRYSYLKQGQAHVEHMKELARVGRGLNSYISSTPSVKYGYESKW